MLIYNNSQNKFQKIFSKFNLINIFAFLASIFFILFLILLALSKARVLQLASKISQKSKEQISILYHRNFTIAPEHFDIDIEFKDLQRIEEKRQEALDLGILLTSDEDFVSAKITYQDKKIPVKLRLKGDWTDHLESDKWSFRVQVKDDKAIIGMKRFSLQEPSTRSYLNEWIFLQALQRENLIALRYDFIDISINGERKGIYAIEEHFSKELVENSSRREGPVFKFSEDKLWQDRAEYNLGEDSGEGYFYDSKIQAFRFNKILANEKLNQEYAEAESLLEKFRIGDLEAAEVFDIAAWAKLFALSDLFGVKHGLAWHNLRFYYNPVTGLIEPIAYDNEPGEHLRRLSIEEDPIKFELINLIFSNKELQELYFKNLEKFSQPKYLNNLFADLNLELSRVEKIINQDILYKFNKNIFYQNQEFIKKKLAEKNIDQDQELENIEIKEDQRFSQDSQIPNFVNINYQNNIYKINAGDWQLKSDLVIPKNYSLIIKAGANLDLINNSAIISHGEVHFDGNQDNQIIINSSDNTGQGLLVLSAQNPSSISYTKFSNLTNIKAASNNITGAINFYESDILIKNILFENNNSEDAVNIIRSKFEIKNSSFNNIYSDAIDIDFGQGKISQTKFENIINDAIDVSGSQVEVSNININRVGDKAISVGEKSELKVENCQINNFNIGMASKDSSHLEVRLCNLNNGQVGVTSYQKKSEYGSSYVEIWNTNFAEVEKNYLVEENSLFYINNSKFLDFQKNVYDGLYSE